MPRDILHTLARHAVDDIVRIRHRGSDAVPVDLQSNESASAELIYLGVRRAVEVQRDIVTILPGLVRPLQDRGIVATHLGAPRAVGRRAVELVQNQAPHRVHAVVHTRGQHKDAEGIFLGWAQPELGAGAVDLRANVHGGAGVVGRDPLGVQGDGGAAGVDEQLDGHGRHGDGVGAVLHASGIAVGTEDLNGGIAGRAEGLEALIGLLAVVEGGGHAMDADVRVGDELEGRPLASLL